MMVDPSQDPQFTWTEIKAVKRPLFYGGFTYRTEEVLCQADWELVERVCGHVIFTLRQDLREIGYLAEADKILAPYLRPAPLNSSD